MATATKSKKAPMFRSQGDPLLGPSVPTVSSISPAQQKALDTIKANLIAKHYGSTAYSYEIKQWDVDVRKHFVSLVFVTGLTGDKGTMAAILCRRRMHIAIGPKGGIKVFTRWSEGKRRGLHRACRPHGPWFEIWSGLGDN